LLPDNFAAELVDSTELFCWLVTERFNVGSAEELPCLMSVECTTEVGDTHVELLCEVVAELCLGEEELDEC
jgi:hypothetical protein